MSRRSFLTASAALSSLACSGHGSESIRAPLVKGSPQSSGDSKTSSKPNIIYILADDMGYGDIGAYNFGASETPAIDRLIHEGVALTQHYAGSAVCTPSRACLLTGRYPQRTGAADTLPESGLNRLALREKTIADHLSAAGYFTGIVGKWHLGWDDPRYRPQKRGFKDAIALEKTQHWDWVLDYNGSRKEHDGRYLADVLTDEAVGFVRRHQDEPFFLYLSHFSPHTPLEAPEEDIRPFLEAGYSRSISVLYGMIRRMDRGIGRLLDELKRLGLDENTIVVFSSDNGPQFSTSWTNRDELTRYNCGFKGHKDLVYEGGIRVPAVIRWPAGLEGKKQIHDMTHFSDWLPTLLDIAGAPIPPDIDGQSMYPLLKGDAQIIAPRRFWQFSRYYPTVWHNAAMRDKEWKLIRPASPEGVDGSVLGVLKPKGIAEPTHSWNTDDFYRPRHMPAAPAQLFNLRQDPSESRNLAAHYPQRVSTMETQLENWFDSVMADLHSAQA